MKCLVYQSVTPDDLRLLAGVLAEMADEMTHQLQADVATIHETWEGDPPTDAEIEQELQDDLALGFKLDWEGRPGWLARLKFITARLRSIQPEPNPDLTGREDANPTPQSAASTDAGAPLPG